MDISKITNSSIITNGIINPLEGTIVNNLSTFVSSVGNFAIKEFMGKLSRTITFNTDRYADSWMEQALYSILGKYNNLKNRNNIFMKTVGGSVDANTAFRLDDGLHVLKYRQWTINLQITTKPALASRSYPYREYNIYTYTLSQDFVDAFERDMKAHRSDYISSGTTPGMLTMFVSETTSSGKEFSYWDKVSPVPARRLNSIYLPIEDKKRIVDTVNAFFTNKKLYRENGIPHNLKILLYGEQGTGKDSVARMIATEWNRNIYYVKPNRYGEMIPDAITDTEMLKPLIVISDIDNYPDVINKVASETGEISTENKVVNTSAFAKMLQALDGFMSGEDKIIFMSTNHIEKFHPTFLRPGRIDLLMELKPVTPYVFRRFIFDKFNVELPEDIELIHDHIKIYDIQSDVLFLKMSLVDIIKKYTKTK